MAFGHRCALILSHDVDRLQTWTLRKIKRAFAQRWREQNLPCLIRTPFQIFSSLSRRDNWQGNFEYILQLEKKYGARSTFFFVSKKNDSADPSYLLNSRRVRTGINRIRDENFHIGLHGSIPSAANRDLLGAEKKELQECTGSPVQGLRFHYLSFDARVSFHAIESNGFRYDSTLGFANETGYRCGTGYPFTPYHQESLQSHTFVEIPLILMDTVLFLESKLSLSARQAGEVIFDNLEETWLNGSCITVNWHNNNISPDDVTGYTALYERILQWGHEHNAWMCSVDELAQWWMRERS
jgi:peptidoglycan/xylan/chitin deacetylase (PgdA/CDA1 family)